MLPIYTVMQFITQNKRYAINVTTLLTSIFYFVIVLRFLFPFYFNPLDNLVGDASRHWPQGINLLNPNVMGSHDPKLFQLWVFLLHLVSQDNRYIIAAFTGGLCASLPWLWYKAVREFSHRNLSYIIAIVIGLCPTPFIIYGYFINDVLLLNMLALASWMTFRAIRKKTTLSFNDAAFSYALAALTKLTALPMVLLCLAYLLFHFDKKLRHLANATYIFTLLAIPAALHTYINFEVLNPFGMTASNAIYNRANTQGFAFKIHFQYYSFISPSYAGAEPFDPFFKYKTYRNKGMFRFHINPENGYSDWREVYNSLTPPFEQHLLNIKENFIYFFFGPPWPDMKSHVATRLPSWLAHYHYHYRWLWLPLALFIAIGCCFIKTTPHRRFFISLTLIMILAMLFQQSGVMEGRFRKPVEPLMLASAIIIFHALLSRFKSRHYSLSLRERQRG